MITGVISDIWLYHGCQVDFGYEVDGCVVTFAAPDDTEDIIIMLISRDYVIASVLQFDQLLFRHAGLFP